MKPITKNDLQIIKKNFIGKHTAEEKDLYKPILVNEESIKQIQRLLK